MKVIVIGDLHGRDVWEKIPDLLSYDRVIFLGDYFDAKDGTKEETQIENFLKILKLKKRSPEKFVLLIGNHDYHYFPFSQTEYSGFSETLYPFVSEILETEYQRGLLDAVFQFDRFLFSHAGITQTWFAENIADPEGLKPELIAAEVAKKWKTNPEAFDFVHREGASPDGNDIFQSPMMVRPISLAQDNFPACTQVVGHTQMAKIVQVGKSLIFCDTLGQSKEILVIDHDKISIKKL